MPTSECSETCKLAEAEIDEDPDFDNEDNGPEDVLAGGTAFTSGDFADYCAKEANTMYYDWLKLRPMDRLNVSTGRPSYRPFQNPQKIQISGISSQMNYSKR
ncbi:hypothetical protein AVEN_214570-1 [Araneus ventricosus]|uniref:Uncharacterized protein n=1 Tax=Araneus ventricosus TaxID=182803 RepID=A0A4Y2L6E7_ARAVE|nr:hypothetical protein AVEN_214570-1 [Araneus ventricosus]